MPVINDKNREILNNIQVDFPIDSRPYKILAQKLGLTEEELIKRINQMKKEMLIRRIGGNFSPDRLGYHSTLCAAKVPEEKITLFTKTVNAYSGVTHNYKRDHEFNIWFTFIAPSVEIIKDSLKQIQKMTDVETILNLPATRVFKISANFKL
ncbi:MAG: Lrp/AsnC family transcriptional regulator [Desulfobacula sp.]|jgi:DNA-binding Lrp family transcriptional regulator|uniref:siroheme decarboxylase subunit alpha n=1 Tax=Desulfobacula sp. TaxID=2593537 RepID=UPI001DDFBADF|nr:Lrp/AsnC family transcriptional regulator [Desulfobacula sp.]MBT3484411.1 Lrp/AsnC family transcriptional regulator [Desulfobacula sp.]MBT3803326.1 Lrp/AsnC family transcriptional regulator [Desulfobacula sp.]MBT4023708.1 Lrp/AsnC family transcriptional regulator [Desulfobacula sp.]MBT4197950.1 Lrp/AsnC family transcriptional regulator [Desulfobacula sp.]